MTQTDGSNGTPGTVLDVDLAIVGAGVCGLNALFVATQYLPRGARIALIDRRAGAGGMWQSTYDYVRLHQPHPMFTVGNMDWSLDQPPQYLARGAEVRDHLRDCLDRLRDRVWILEYFGHEALDIAETATGVTMTLRAVDGGGLTRIRADRAVHAAGYAISEMTPLEFSTDRVVSTAPRDLAGTLESHPDVPVYVIGGGKTSMDTVLAVLDADPGRKVHVINGPGTFFINRDNNFPLGRCRWTRGRPASSSFAEIAMRFDGENEHDLCRYAYETFGICPTGVPGQSMFGILSEAENARLRAGIHAVIPGYLADVERGADGPEMVMRDGSRHGVPEGAILVNCTGCYFHDHPEGLSRPCVSEHGRLITITKRHSLHFMTSVAGYFLTHMMFLDRHRSVPLYAIDAESLNRKSRHAYFAADATQIYLNLMLWAGAMPLRVLNDCHLDLDRWFPMPRRIAAAVRMLATRKAHMAHCRASLDRIGERFDIACHPIC